MIRYLSLFLLVISFSLSCKQKAKKQGGNDKAASIPVIPAPNGAFSIGTSVFHLVDSSRVDYVTKKKGDFAELMIQVWYPAIISDNSEIAPYVIDQRITQEMFKQQFSSRDSVLQLDTMVTSAYLNAPVLNDRNKYPVLIGSPGLGIPGFAYTSFAQEFASHGYIVIIISHPYDFCIFPDGRKKTAAEFANFEDNDSTNTLITEQRAADVSFVLSALTNGRNNMLARFIPVIDPAKAAVFGHSIGGAVALEASRLDHRFKAAIDLDGAPFGDVQKTGFVSPTLVFASQPEYSDEDLAKKGRTKEQMAARSKERANRWLPLFANAKKDKFWLKISGTSHVHFCDYPFIFPQLYAMFGGTYINSKRGIDIIAMYMKEFFDIYLKDSKPKLFESEIKQYPEVTLSKMPE